MKKVLTSSVVLIFMFCIIGLTHSKSFIPKKPVVSVDLQQPGNLDKGVGPYKSYKVEALDMAKAKKGGAIFKEKCIVCHELDKVKVGPPLRNVTKDRSPEFILNNIVNPTGMQKEDAEIKKEMKKYNNVPMADLKTTKADAELLFEYLRSVAKK